MEKKHVVWVALAAGGVAGLLAFILALVAMRLEIARSGPAPLNTATIIQRIQHLAEMVTVKYVMEKVIVLEDPKYLGGVIPLGENRIILMAHGQVKAGVDFSRLTSEDVAVTGHKIVITLPHPVVTDAYLIEGQTQVLDYKTGLFTPFDKSLEQTARRYALTEITRAARQNGIEREAGEQARQQMTRLLQALGFAEVEVRMRSK
jgi:hypothetical protein